MRQDGDIGSMDYDQAVKNGEIFFGWSTWMEQDGYAPGESIAFDFENGSETYTYQGKIAGYSPLVRIIKSGSGKSFVSR